MSGGGTIHKCFNTPAKIPLMNFDLAVIGGLGFSLEGLQDEVETPYGRLPLIRSRMKGIKVAFLSRHGEDHLPPHRVNYRALICAAKRSGAGAVISINTVGSMAGHAPGSIFIPSDFVEFTSCRPNTFFDDRAVHVDMSQPYCPALRSALAAGGPGRRPAGRGRCLRLRPGTPPGVPGPDQDDAPVRGRGGNDRLPRSGPGQGGGLMLCILMHGHQSRGGNVRKPPGIDRYLRFDEKQPRRIDGDSATGRFAFSSRKVLPLQKCSG